MSERPHGYVRYQIDGCRCYICCWARAEYERQRQAAIAAGTWRPFVDAAPARGDLFAMKAEGVSEKRIADLSGVHYRTIAALLRGSGSGRARSRKVRPETAAAIRDAATTLLAGGPESADWTRGDFAEATGTTRRLRALACRGFTFTYLAGRIGMNAECLGDIGHRPHVLAATAAKVTALYDELWQADPLDHGICLNSAVRAKGRATREGWAPVGAWDDDSIDDPDALPDWTGQCGTDAGYETHRRLKLLPPCPRCKAGHTQTLKERAAARKEQHNAARTAARAAARAERAAGEQVAA